MENNKPITTGNKELDSVLKNGLTSDEMATFGCFVPTGEKLTPEEIKQKRPIVSDLRTGGERGRE
jgi:hypothetical protein